MATQPVRCPDYRVNDHALGTAWFCPVVRRDAIPPDSIAPDWFEQARQQRLEATILVVNDGSTDDTAAIGVRYGVRRLTHPYSMGNGAAVKAGARTSGGGGTGVRPRPAAGTDHQLD